jgi:hypothetical protein
MDPSHPARRARRVERFRGEFTERRTRFAAELQALGARPSRDSLERLMARAQDLQLDDHTAPELRDARALLATATIREDILRGRLPVVASLHPLPPGDRCHFVAPARFGRRRSDQYGHLALTSGWLRFHGALDLSVTWGEVARVERTDHDVAIALHDSHRLLRFYCPTVEDAATAEVIASHLAAEARRAEYRHAGDGAPQPTY